MSSQLKSAKNFFILCLGAGLIGLAPMFVRWSELSPSWILFYRMFLALPFLALLNIYFNRSDAFKLKSEVVDTTGAGDAFNGALAYALSKNQNNRDAIVFSNKVAGISTTKSGAANSIPTISEVENY